MNNLSWWSTRRGEAPHPMGCVRIFASEEEARACASDWRSHRPRPAEVRRFRRTVRAGGIEAVVFVVVVRMGKAGGSCTAKVTLVSWAFPEGEREERKP